MPNRCCDRSSPRSALPIAVSVVVLAGWVAVGIGELAENLGRIISLPEAAWIPLSAAAVPATVFGLWLGFRTHGRGEPLALGLFGLGVGCVGLLVGYPITVLGVVITLGAAMWSAMVQVPEQSGG